MLKLERNRARRTRKRERRRISFYNARQDAVQIGREMHLAMKIENRRKHDNKHTDGKFGRILLQQCASLALGTAKTDNTHVEKKNSDQKKEPMARNAKIGVAEGNSGQSKNMTINAENQTTNKTVKEANTEKKNATPIHKENKITITKEKIAQKLPETPQRKEEEKSFGFGNARWEEKTPVEKSSKPTIQKVKAKEQIQKWLQGPYGSKKPATQKANKDDMEKKTNQEKIPKTKSTGTWIEIEDVGSDVEEDLKQQIEDDYLVAVDMQNKQDTGVDMVEQNKGVKKKNNDNNAEGKKPFTEKSKTVIESPSNLHENAMHVKDLKGSKKPLHVTKSDQEISTRSKASAAESKKPVPPNIAADVVKSAGDGAGLQKQEARTDVLIPWQKRSKRWSHLFEKLIDLPNNKREKSGAIQFSFSDESLYIAKG